MHQDPLLVSVVLVPPEVLFASVCSAFKSALFRQRCCRQDAVAPVTKGRDKVSTLIELYFIFNLLEYNIYNVVSYWGKRFVFRCILCPDCDFGLGMRIGVFQKFSVRLVRSIRIPGCDALIQNSNCVEITIGCTTLTAVIYVFGFMLLVVIVVLF